MRIAFFDAKPYDKPSFEKFGAENFNYLNKEREIEFTYKNIKYKIKIERFFYYISVYKRAKT